MLTRSLYTRGVVTGLLVLGWVAVIVLATVTLTALAALVLL